MSSQGSFFSGTSVKELSDSDFVMQGGVWGLKPNSILARNCTAILFYAPWCGYCQRVKQSWIEFGDNMRSQNGILVRALNCEKYSKMISQVREDMPQLISGYPTMLIFKNGVPDRKIGTDETKRSSNELSKSCVDICRGK